MGKSISKAFRINGKDASFNAISVKRVIPKEFTDIMCVDVFGVCSDQMRTAAIQSQLNSICSRFEKLVRAVPFVGSWDQCEADVGARRLQIFRLAFTSPEIRSMQYSNAALMRNQENRHAKRGRQKAFRKA